MIFGLILAAALGVSVWAIGRDWKRVTREGCQHRYTFCIQMLSGGAETHECLQCHNWVLVQGPEDWEDEHVEPVPPL